MLLPIASISRTLLQRFNPEGDGVITARGSSLTLLSRHRRVLNLQADASVFSLVWPQVGNGPFHAVLAGPLDFEEVLPSHLQLTLSDARLWDPRLPPGAERVSQLDALRPLVELTATHAAPSTDLEARARWRVRSTLQQLVRALVDDRLELVQEAVLGLAGFGPGLTPAGDDALLGLLAGLWLCPHLDGRPIDPAPVAQCVAATAAPRTTRLSATWLRHAGQGEFGAPWHALARALSSGGSADCLAALRLIRATGASSGTDALLGLAAWCRAATLTPEI